MRRQLEDWKAAVAYVRSLAELDGDRVAIWGSSFGGGHVIATAAEVPVTAAIAQAPFTHGPASAMTISPLTSARLAGLAVQDLRNAALGREPVMVALVVEPGTTVCNKDSVAPARTTSRLVNKAARAEVVHRPVRHFDLYTGEEFEGVVADQLGFLQRHMPVEAR